MRIRTRVEVEDFMAIRFLEVCFWTDCAIWAGFKGSLEKEAQEKENKVSFSEMKPFWPQECEKK
jgi:hypothetical protein